MTSTVKVMMNTCQRYALITGELDEDGCTVHVKIESDCENVMQYARLLGDTVTMDDCMDAASSKVFDPAVRAPLTLNCLVPSAVMDVCMMELGMLLKSCARKAERDTVEYL